MARLIGTKWINIDGQLVECKVYATRQAAGCKTFDQKMKVRGKGDARIRNGRKTEIRTRNLQEPGDYLDGSLAAALGVID
jgi:hypothetical protein